MRARIAGRIGLAGASGALCALYAVHPQLAFLPRFCLVPWAILYSDPRERRVSALYYAVSQWLAWIVFYAASFRYGWYAPPLMGLLAYWPFLVFPFLFRPMQRLGLPRVLTLPLAWVAVEWIRARLTLGHFDLFLLGYSQARFVRLVQIADITGVYGVSFLVAAFNGLVADAYFVLRDGGWGWRSLFENRTLVRSTVAFMGAAILVLAYGTWRVATLPREAGPRLAVIQPNLAHTRSNYLGVTLSELAQTDFAVGEGKADLIVWPENAILDDFTRKDAYLPLLGALAQKKRAWLLVGAEGYPPTRPDRTTNSAFLVDDTGTVRGRYDKQVLFTWSEEIPFEGTLGRIAPSLQTLHRTLARKAWGHVPTGVPGDGMTLFDLPWRGATLPFAVVICVENSYPPLVSAAGTMGARFLVNITSEGEVSGPVQEQLLRICILRAVESHLAYVRCGNAGISGFIEPDGRIRSILTNSRGGTIGIPGSLTDTVVLSGGGPTIYARSHDAFAVICVAVAAGLALAGLVRGRRIAGTAPALVLLVLTSTSGCGQGRAFDAVCPDEAACRQALPGMADTFRRTDGAERGVVAFTRVAERFPALGPEALAYRAYFRDRAGDLLGAAADCEASLRGRADARTWANLGSLRARMHDPRAALDAFVQADHLSPGEPEILFLIARSHWEIGDLEEARRAVDDLLAKTPAHASGLTLQGKLDLAAGRTDAAAASFQAAASADPENLESRYYLARLAWRDGRDGEFKRWLDEVKSIEAKLERPRG